MAIKIIQGDAIAGLKTLPSGSVHCCVTSPPYWGLRDYGVTDQLGLERTPEEYVEKIVLVFQELRRVLRDDGTLWLNLGDSYSSGNRATYCSGASNNLGHLAQNGLLRPRNPEKVKAKNLIGIPWRIAFALQADMWYLRSDIIWVKSSIMPESVTDRPTKSHEYVFLLAKSERYFYDAEAVKEKSIKAGKIITFEKKSLLCSADKRVNVPSRGNGRTQLRVPPFRNLRDVWTISTKPFSLTFYDFSGADSVDDRGIPRKRSPNCPVHKQDGLLRREDRENEDKCLCPISQQSHFATFPTALVEPCIKAGTSEKG